ncbi:MAG: pitrilysin family protein [Candidatus Binatus sp.]|uniref:M16 family metallopeptidase n=1 Tax=Candidatus Binatus sp. TaxID=2811406 RepID=UPI002722A439|nr:pitrilysin family protein [Candidatus Binatus sp.]MDO8434321.1 pitrilysin family protein [Candidatus Binatus sp.]
MIAFIRSIDAGSIARKTASIAMIAATLSLFAASPLLALDIKRMTLSNGAVLLVSEEHQLPMVTLSIAFDAGARRDPKGKEGLAELTARCLSQGTKQLTSTEFDQKVDFMGSSVGVNAGRDYASAGMTTLKKYQGDTLKLLAGILVEPGLRDADIERKRAEQVAQIKAEEEQPGYTAEVAFTQELFGDSPYGHLDAGSAESAGKLTIDDVRNFYRDYYKLGSAVIAVAGDVTADEIKTSLEKELAGLSGAVSPQPEPAALNVALGLHLKLIDRSVQQANIIMGFGGVARSNPDYYRLQVMNYILGGGGFASRLMQVVRSKGGLAYSIGSGFEPGKFPGSFTVSLQTKNQSSNQAIDLILKQLREIQEKPVSDAELDGARKFLIGSFPLKIDKQSGIASFMLQVELYGLGLDYAEKYPKLIEAITKEDVQRAAKEYLHPGSVIVVAVANQNEAKINSANLEKQVSSPAASQ